MKISHFVLLVSLVFVSRSAFAIEPPGPTEKERAAMRQIERELVAQRAKEKREERAAVTVAKKSSPNAKMSIVPRRKSYNRPRPVSPVAVYQAAYMQRAMMQARTPWVYVPGR